MKNSEKNSLEAKENGGNNLLSGDGGRAVDESAGKQTGRVSSYKRKIEGREATQRKSAAKEIALKGNTEEVVDGNRKYTLVKEEAYNDDMKTIAAASSEKLIARKSKITFISGRTRVKSIIPLWK